MFVSTAIINTVFIVIVWSNIIQIPYTHEGIHTSKIIVATTTAANIVGEISFLIPANANNIYIAISNTQTINAFFADFCIYAPTLGHVIDCSTTSLVLFIYPF
jgi:hypothetical protein